MVSHNISLAPIQTSSSPKHEGAEGTLNSDETVQWFSLNQLVQAVSPSWPPIQDWKTSNQHSISSGLALQLAVVPHATLSAVRGVSSFELRPERLGKQQRNLSARDRSLQPSWKVALRQYLSSTHLATLDGGSSLLRAPVGCTLLKGPGLASKLSSKPRALSVVLGGSYSSSECKSSGILAALNRDISFLWLPNVHESFITTKGPCSKSSRSQPKPDGDHHITPPRYGSNQSAC
ncbi:hypothetical protein CI238_00389 [Colletotrichum incanum]|uniref:Uncharacterized protein n=1 Tax=Colletotrichum incanum TaxID=1573173 RepID=A0A161W339_COLIC|nr:hypothetical protein CI238_00389 [Colletotrichum incanum]